MTNTWQDNVSEAAPVISADERELVVTKWNDTSAEFPATATLHQLIEAVVRRSPDVTALVFGTRRMSYAELNSAANRLARRLRAIGVGPEITVAVHAERSLELVVGLLAVLKAGGAFMPLDPDLPAERIGFMVHDAGTPVLLTQRHLSGALPPHSATTLLLDQPADWATESGIDLDPLAAPEHPAYAIFTSGSTGTPKAVLNVHRAVCNRLHWMQREFTLTTEDAVLQKTPTAFDVSVWEFFWPLLAGARLVLAEPGSHRDPALLRDLIAEHRITTVHFVPSMLAAFLAADGIERCRSLRRTISSGEELPANLIDTFFERLPGTLHNLYGPTEAAIDVSTWTCVRLPPSARSVPIGRPIQNVKLYVLDDDFEPVPIEAVGELHIGGIALARGYLNRPALTAERFVPDPFARGGGRLYRTGDLARWRTDGVLEYLGRRDNQVKVRGYRIEPGEIETTLRQHPDVGNAIVTIDKDNDGSHRLNAHIVSDAGTCPTSRTLREHLAARLPEYMVPNRFWRLPRTPLTHNGKTDRNAVAADPDPTPLDAPATTTRYHNPLEHLIAKIWAHVLDGATPERDHDVYATGAHSLNALRAKARITTALHIDLPLPVFIQSRTVAQLADAITEHTDSPTTLHIRADAIARLPEMDDADWIEAVTTLEVEES